MTLTWKQSAFGTDYAYLGKIEVGSVNWVSARRNAPDGESGYQFKSVLFGAAPDVPEYGGVYPTKEGAMTEAADMAVAYADYIGRTVHGDEAWGRVTRGL